MLMKYTIDKYIIRVLYDRLLQNGKNNLDIPEWEIFLREGKFRVMLHFAATVRCDCLSFVTYLHLPHSELNMGTKFLINHIFNMCVCFIRSVPRLIWQFWPIVKSTKMNLFFRNSKINKFRFCLLVPHWEYFAQCGLEWRYITSLFKNMRFMLDKKVLSKVFDKNFFNLCLFYFLQE